MDDEPLDITGVNVREEKKNTVADLVNSPTFHAYVKQVLVRKFARDFGKNPEDLEQDFWVNVLKPSQLLKTIDYPKAWAGTIIRNLCINQGRDTQRERASTEHLELEDGRIREIAAPDEATATDDTSNDFDRPTLTQEQKDKICAKVMSILETLPPEERVVVHLFLMTIPVEVIAMQMQKSRATVYRLAKGKKAIWKQIVTELGVEALHKEPSVKKALGKLVASSLREIRPDIS